MFKLYFDTSSRDKILVRLYKNKKIIAEKSAVRHLTSQILLPLIDNICNQNNLAPQMIQEVEFNRGPGSYTGLKVGAAVANSFAWYLKIAVNGRKNKIILPKFE